MIGRIHDRKLNPISGKIFLEKDIGVKATHLTKRYRGHRYSGIKLSEIGACFDIGESGVSQTNRRFSEKLKKDKKVRKTTEFLKKKLNM